jgi:hypothetical protein
MFPADESAAIPSPKQVAYASIEWLMWALQAPTSESAIAAESEAERVGVVGAVASVSAGMSLMPACPSCCAKMGDAKTPIAAIPSTTECLLPKDEIFRSDKSVPDREGKSIRSDGAISDYHRALLPFQLRRLRFCASCPECPTVHRASCGQGRELLARFIAIPD